MGTTVVIVGRSAEKTAQVVAEIRVVKTGNQNVDDLLADLSSQQEIRRLADEFKAGMRDLIFYSITRVPYLCNARSVWMASK